MDFWSFQKKIPTLAPYIKRYLNRMPRFELNILGCGSATSTLRHLPTSQVLNVRDNVMMIDCGEGAQLEMRRRKLKFARLTNIFISHLHGDHCFGLPGLLSTLALLQKSSSVTVHIFEDGAEMFSSMMDYFCRDRCYELRFNVITKEPRVIYEDSAITVRTFPLRHRVPAVGFVFEEKAKMRHVNAEAVRAFEVPQHFMNSLRQGMDYVTPAGVVIPNEKLTTAADASVSYAYASDTTYSERVIQAVEGVDWLYHEATYGDEFEAQAHQRFHSTARQAAMVAKEAGVKQLILGHYSSRYTDARPLLQQAQEVFPATRLANEGDCIDLMNY